MECKIIPEKCIACGLCQVYAPEIFDYTEDGIVLFLNEPDTLSLSIDDKDAAAVTTAYRKCPVRAIEIRENT
ncbi:ferredoxin [uncultured Enterococcus sp.]|uniref:ferredoxin n=1 Tax=uncultured Enterococcus sp. TaxID=167972 RepID=UPI002AA7F0A8|nr:ferredoxin [uncultured Enterococcus sp.]